jgi:hypothetical protein
MHPLAGGLRGCRGAVLCCGEPRAGRRPGWFRFDPARLESAGQRHQWLDPDHQLDPHRADGGRGRHRLPPGDGRRGWSALGATPACRVRGGHGGCRSLPGRPDGRLPGRNPRRPPGRPYFVRNAALRVRRHRVSGADYRDVRAGQAVPPGRPAWAGSRQYRHRSSVPGRLCGHRVRIHLTGDHPDLHRGGAAGLGLAEQHLGPPCTGNCPDLFTSTPHRSEGATKCATSSY